MLYLAPRRGFDLENDDEDDDDDLVCYYYYYIIYSFYLNFSVMDCAAHYSLMNGVISCRMLATTWGDE
jgi:hypothetical protein